MIDSSSSSSGDTISAFSLRDNLPHLLTAHRSTVTSIVQLESDGTIVSCSDDATLKRYTVDGRFLNSYVGHEDDVMYVIELTEDVIVSASWDGAIKKWNFNTNECIKTLETFATISGC